jgi:glycosidase
MATQVSRVSDGMRDSQMRHILIFRSTKLVPKFKFEVNKVQRLIMEGAWGTVFMENHDQCRSVERYATPDPQYHSLAAKLLCLLQTTLSGTEFVFQGQEIAMTNVPKHWKKHEYRDVAALNYINNQERELGAYGLQRAVGSVQRFGRDNGRTPMQWTGGNNAGFSDAPEGETWIQVHENSRHGQNVEDQKKDPNSVWNFWKQQITLRKENKDVFMHAKFEVLDETNENTFHYLKTANSGATALICLNFTDKAQNIFLPPAVDNVAQLFWISGNLGTPSHRDSTLKPWEGRVYAVPTAASLKTQSDLKERFKDAVVEEASNVMKSLQLPVQRSQL